MRLRELEVETTQGSLRALYSRRLRTLYAIQEVAVQAEELCPPRLRHSLPSERFSVKADEWGIESVVQ